MRVQQPLQILEGWNAALNDVVISDTVAMT
jgi:hypothetical protein